MEKRDWVLVVGVIIMAAIVTQNTPVPDITGYAAANADCSGGSKSKCQGPMEEKIELCAAAQQDDTKASLGTVYVCSVKRTWCHWIAQGSKIEESDGGHCQVFPPLFQTTIKLDAKSPGGAGYDPPIDCESTVVTNVDIGPGGDETEIPMDDTTDPDNCFHDTPSGGFGSQNELVIWRSGGSFRGEYKGDDGNPFGGNDADDVSFEDFRGPVRPANNLIACQVLKQGTPCEDL